MYNSRTASSTKANGSAPIDTDTAYNIGPMEPNTKVSGRRTRPVERESSPILMATHMRVNGRMIKPTGLEYISTLSPKPNMKVTGNTI